MHKTDGNGHVSNLFDDGDPGVPRLPTQLDKDWLNAVQEEIANCITAAGIALVKGTNNQLSSAVVHKALSETITGLKNFTAGLTAIVSGNNVAASFESEAEAGGFVVSINNALDGKGLEVTATANTAIETSVASGNNSAIVATGSGTGKGIVATGGATGTGVQGIGGATSGVGGNFTGGPTSAGVTATGGTGAAFAPGGNFIGGTNGNGVNSSGSGTGNGANLSSSGTGYGAFVAGTSAKAPVHLVPQAAPSGGSRGDLYSSSADGHLYYHNGSTWVQLS